MLDTTDEAAPTPTDAAEPVNENQAAGSSIGSAADSGGTGFPWVATATGVLFAAGGIPLSLRLR